MQAFRRRMFTAVLVFGWDHALQRVNKPSLGTSWLGRSPRSLHGTPTSFLNLGSPDFRAAMSVEEFLNVLSCSYDGTGETLDCFGSTAAEPIHHHPRRPGAISRVRQRGAIIAEGPLMLRVSQHPCYSRKLVELRS